ncbi:hypothetical protein PF010_g992 [Phytophthora fragariae]|uniref:Secreted protein n=1 Tax=Phytophthora fragariae TaxID=53985 RepID=A0A6G0PSJ5_9STRA|nr:hypothetical protein PF010_g992 [Phytophthora fragariae]KAE9253704.1 hypothetical protein PF004_g1372 [Phytophthora fragariae]KAE9360989.1 hypothetical protein PF008_g1473 [Phytophthora fragariae]
MICLLLSSLSCSRILSATRNLGTCLDTFQRAHSGLRSYLSNENCKLDQPRTIRSCFGLLLRRFRSHTAAIAARSTTSKSSSSVCVLISSVSTQPLFSVPSQTIC